MITLGYIKLCIRSLSMHSSTQAVLPPVVLILRNNGRQNHLNHSVNFTTLILATTPPRHALQHSSEKHTCEDHAGIKQSCPHAHSQDVMVSPKSELATF
eukprot:c35091_g1_i1 orf=1-294(-)